MPWWLILIPIGAFLFGAIFFLIGWFIGGPGSKKWHRAHGVAFTHPGMWHFVGTSQGYRWWGPDGAVREGRKVFRGFPLQEGAPVSVLFNPEDLDRFRLDTGPESGVFLKIAGVVVFLLGLIVTGFIAMIIVMLGPFPSA